MPPGRPRKTLAVGYAEIAKAVKVSEAAIRQAACRGSLDPSDLVSVCRFVALRQKDIVVRHEVDRAVQHAVREVAERIHAAYRRREQQRPAAHLDEWRAILRMEEQVRRVTSTVFPAMPNTR